MLRQIFLYLAGHTHRPNYLWDLGDGEHDNVMQEHDRFKFVSFSRLLYTWPGNHFSSDKLYASHNEDIEQLNLDQTDFHDITFRTPKVVFTYCDGLDLG